ncbi:hypothetical protein J8J27_26405, partial [Mycobacterium tuberculosis]|nr:hypothetical protein [Mycobacterium tuberculosis]
MKEAGADIVIALVHSGIDASGQVDGMENAAFYVAGVPGIDVVMTGHQHLVFPDVSPTAAFKDGPGIDNKAGTLQGKPAVQAGFWG